MPLVHDLGAADNVVAVEAGGRQTGVIGDDAEASSRVQGLNAWSREGAVLLGQTDETETREGMLILESYR
jgi:hypothetical protein